MTVNIYGGLTPDQLDRIEAKLNSIEPKLDRIIQQETEELAEIDDLKASVAGIAQADLDVAQGLKDVSAKLQAPGIDPAEVESLAQQISAHAVNLETSAKGLEAAAGVQVSAPSNTAPATPSATAGATGDATT